jgi:outer membrane protein OmpA-like peptidoglycan-associated protein
MMNRFVMGLGLAVLLVCGLATLLVLNLVAVPRLIAWVSREASGAQAGGPPRLTSSPSGVGAADQEPLMVFEEMLDGGAEDAGVVALEADDGRDTQGDAGSTSREANAGSEAASVGAMSCATIEHDERLDAALSRRIENLLFGPSRTLLWKGEKKALDRLAAVLEIHADKGVLLCGHALAGERGGDVRGLSAERAGVAAEYLEKRGIDAGRVRAEGVGSGHPVETRSEEKSVARSRRVEVFVYDRGGAR